jgi:hypothetical protein
VHNVPAAEVVKLGSIHLYRVRQASFLSPSDRSVQKRKLACRTFIFAYLFTVSLTTLTVTHKNKINNWKGYEKRQSCHNLMYYSRISEPQEDHDRLQ